MVQRGNFGGRNRGGRRGRGNNHRGGGRGNHHRGGGRGRGSFHRSNDNSRDNKSLYKPEQLSEKEVGITEYISTLDGFSAVIKARFSDFHVNEIDLDGNIAKLTNTSVPKEFQIVKVEVPVETPLKDITEQQWQEIKTVLENEDDSLSVKIDVSQNDKESRSLIHKTLKSIFLTKIISNTIEEGDNKFIIIKKQTGNNKRDRSDEWPTQLPVYTHFLLYKESIDTMNAIMSISDALRMNSTAFNYAGVKDRRAKTTQWISCKKLEPSKLIYRTKRLRNIKIGNIKFTDEPLKLGQLKGNLFRIALRDVTAADDVINAHLEHLKELGFINYYGLQRFGNDKTVPTYEIGVKLLQGHFREACNLILKPKNYDNPLAEITQAKKIYEETQNAQEAVKKLTSNYSVETKLIHGLAKFGKNDVVSALECIPRNMRLMYIHAFQSLIWNQAVSKRIKDFGCKPVVGDLVYLSEEEENELILDDVKGLKDDVPTNEGEINENSETNEERKLSEEENTEQYDKKKNVKILTEEDLPNYTIYDVVLPLPGYDVTYPDNLKNTYVDLLQTFNLHIEMPKQRVKCYTLSGTYRKIVSKAEDLKWHTIKYTGPNATLIRSDFEEILNHTEPLDDPEGTSKGLVVEFKLKSSSYATMLLREVLKIDTSSQNQSKLSAQNASGVGTPKIVEEVTPMQAEGSLFEDKDRYDAFKKLIEEEGDGEVVSAPVKRPSEDECRSAKKARVADNDDEHDEGIKIQPSLV